LFINGVIRLINNYLRF